MLDLYLHIGMPKAGSTDLQSHCMRHRGIFADHRILYVDPPGGGRSHRALFRDVVADEVGGEDPWQALQQQVEEARPTRVILSEEDLFFVDETGIAEIAHLLSRYLGPHRAHLVVYLRRQDLWLESRYKHAVRAKSVRFAGSIDDFLLESTEADAVLDYEATLDRWTAGLAPASIHVRPFEAAQLQGADGNGGLITDFGCLLALPNVGTTLDPDARRNVALERGPLELLRATNRLDIEPQDRRRVLRAARKASNESRIRGSAWPHPLLSPRRRREILEAAKRANAAVALRYLGREDGRLFLEAPSVNDGSWQPHPGLSPEIVQLVLRHLERSDRSIDAGESTAGLVPRILSAALGGTAGHPDNLDSETNRSADACHRSRHAPRLTARGGRAMLRGFGRSVRALVGGKR